MSSVARDGETNPLEKPRPVAEPLRYIRPGEIAARSFHDLGNLQEEVLADRQELKKIENQHVGKDLDFHGLNSEIDYFRFSSVTDSGRALG